MHKSLSMLYAFSFLYVCLKNYGENMIILHKTQHHEAIKITKALKWFKIIKLLWKESAICHNFFSNGFAHNVVSTRYLSSSLTPNMTWYNVDTMSSHLWIQMMTKCIVEHLKSNLIAKLHVMVKENI